MIALPPRLAGVIFAGFLTAFLIISMLMRYLSWRHFRRIDRMLEADKGDE